MRAIPVCMSIMLLALATVVGCKQGSPSREKKPIQAPSVAVMRPMGTPARMRLHYRIPPAHPHSRTAIRACRQALKRAPTLPTRQRQQLLSRACSRLFANPSCRSAWARTAYLGTSDGMLDHLKSAFEACRRAYCPELLRWRRDRVLPRPKAVSWKVCEVKALPEQQPDRMIMIKELLSLIFIRDHCGVLKSNLPARVSLELVTRDLEKHAQLHRLSYRMIKALLDTVEIDTPKLIR